MNNTFLLMASGCMNMKIVHILNIFGKKRLKSKVGENYKSLSTQLYVKKIKY
jgi:hypothetical protein